MFLHASTVFVALSLIAVLGTFQAEGKVVDDGPQHLSDMSSIGQSLHSAEQRPVHILYVHGMDALGAGDSWTFQRGICGFLEGCQMPDTPVPVEREYVDRGIFQIGANPPGFDYMGTPIWSSATEWSASVPFVDHYLLKRSDGGPVVVDEINWWPLVFPLKCRNIIPGEAQLAGPDSALLDLCAKQTQVDTQHAGRFKSYQWVTPEDVAKLKSLPRRGAWLNRSLKNSILDWGVSDAFLAVGSMRDVFREGMRQLFVKSAGFRANGTKTSEWQQELKSRQGTDREFIVVSHSLGSYLVFSTLNIGQLDDSMLNGQTSGQTNSIEDDAARYILERTSLVYFFANQVALLELANEEMPNPVSAVSAQAQPQAVTTLSKRMAVWGRLREEYRRGRNLTEQSAAPQVIAWSDPSDLLTWHVPAIAGINVDNVYVRNSWWHWLAASPTKAHVGYAGNKTVLNVMMGR